MRVECQGEYRDGDFYAVLDNGKILIRIEPASVFQFYGIWFYAKPIHWYGFNHPLISLHKISEAMSQEDPSTIWRNLTTRSGNVLKPVRGTFAQDYQSATKGLWHEKRNGNALEEAVWACEFSTQRNVLRVEPDRSFVVPFGGNLCPHITYGNYYGWFSDSNTYQLLLPPVNVTPSNWPEFGDQAHFDCHDGPGHILVTIHTYLVLATAGIRYSGGVHSIYLEKLMVYYVPKVAELSEIATAVLSAKNLSFVDERILRKWGD